jgi:signal transduction histidine kinase
MLLSLRPRSAFSVKPGLLVGVALSFGVGLLFYYLVWAMIDKENEERFHSMAHVAQSNLNARIASYTNVLRASASFFNAEPDVTREKFRRFYNGLNLQKYYPAIASLNYATWITDAERDAAEAHVRDELAQVYKEGPPFRISPPGRRPNYAPVVYVEPEAKWYQTLGWDVTAQPVTYEALKLARDTGEISASGTPLAVLKERKRLGLAMRIPVYRPGAPVATVEQRRAAYHGSVGVGFSVKKLVDGVLDEVPVKAVRLSLYNEPQSVEGVARHSQLIYDSSSPTEIPSEKEKIDDVPKFHVWLPIDFNGREWAAHLSAPKHAVYRAGDTSFPLMAMLAGFATTMLLFLGFYTLTTSRARAVEMARGMTSELRESQEQLLASHRKLRELAAHAEHIKEDERKRIAREIHDDLGQNLFALRIEAQMLFARTRERHPRLHARVENTLTQIDATIKSVRQIINDLRPNVLDLGLNAAVDWQIGEFRRRTGIQVDFVEYEKEIALDDACATALFRILQEALTNVNRHASASWVRVELGAERNLVRMSIRDNGIGLHSNRNKPGKFGLIGIAERVSILGGTISLFPSPGGGTTVEVAIPARQENSHNLRAVHPSEEPQEDALV